METIDVCSRHRIQNLKEAPANASQTQFANTEEVQSATNPYRNIPCNSSVGICFRLSLAI